MSVHLLGGDTSVPDAVERRIADAPLSAHLATARDCRPHVAPVWYAYEDGSLWLFTGGRKRRNLRANGRVAVSIERADPEGSVDWQVTLLGTARIVDDDRAAAVEAALADKYGYGEADDAGDGGNEDEAGGDGDGGDGDGSDGGSDGGSDEGDAGALVEIAVGSTSLSEY